MMDPLEEHLSQELDPALAVDMEGALEMTNEMSDKNFVQQFDDMYRALQGPECSLNMIGTHAVYTAAILTVGKIIQKSIADLAVTIESSQSERNACAGHVAREEKSSIIME